MNLNQTDLIVSDVPKATQVLASLLNLAVDYADEHFAQFTLGSHCLMVSDHPLKSIPSLHGGIILHIEVDCVDKEVERLKSSGFTINNGPVKTAWGTYSIWVEGPEGVMLDFYQFSED
ncbi:VOC family protein [Streptococcus dysgalactiae]|uniref:Glyoxalase n=1 Tax=Streptococcus dysgalactiae TaxID=1334 RepID=A0A9X9SI02_STRDY|nr:VOC family protein [Streptococcus dysgalactiae]VTS49211.1 glyoxalase [Streptococcus dysgalactiae subsp. equisimilis]VTS49837.1 glyoxalase [Streptococcus dysgalactiae subsp. equisimilis]VTS78208.1 glyoxalase [Streptococcus dysgalactiae]